MQNFISTQKRGVARWGRGAGAALTAAAGLTVLAATGAFAGPSGQGSVQGQAPSHAQGDWAETAFRGHVDVAEGAAADAETLTGVVFDDRNHNSTQDRGERGIKGVKVSNGREVVTTDAHGAYELPAYENMTAFVTQPSGWQVPVDEDNVAQFHYNHLPEGTPEDLDFGGIAPTGALPEAVNFPLVKARATGGKQQSCVIGGDIQTYTEQEVEFAREGAFTDLAARTDYTGCGALFIGDVVGDDLSLYGKTRELAGMLNGPARFLPGNHDLDFDAVSNEHSFDTFREQLAPEYYSYDVGNAHVIALNTVDYQAGSSYNGALDERQLEWLRNDLANTPEDKLVVLGAHIPLLDFADSSASRHQVDQVAEIFEMLEGREAVALGGHTHSIENMRAGDSLAGWNELFGVKELPFTHITAGAISGDWFSGADTGNGYPEAIQRDGGRPGVLTLDIKDTDVVERFTVRGEDDDFQMALGLNTPTYRDWYAANLDNAGQAEEFAAPATVTGDDLAGTTWLTTNFWMGSTGSTVEVELNGETTEAVRTQPMQGEDVHVGAEYSDPVAVQEQLVHGGSLADRTMHLWRFELPEDLAAGEHTATVTATDVHGREFTEDITFTIAR
ncbi:calcineurin-like phosphoesterase family protein [Zhihengliuella flava]|uniref:3',5'-cyclic AMP phosphodiesterase CpdA n=1 Tax=Zhihengliuella flava TaxID=1285193 RepID=A0A931DBZ3_9MICC|nr:3',5'-cyclic AMP phosphodiesterase CpdA [Zhihengliuella flava]